MAAQHQVGKTAAALVLVLVGEILCKVNVKVNVGRDSITGHIEGGTFVPSSGGSPSTSQDYQSFGPAAHGPGRGSPSPSQVYRSLGSTDDVNGISRSSPRWSKCQSKLWAKECEEGTVVIETMGEITEEVCNLLCLKTKDCKTFIFAEGTECALTSAIEGTTQSIGISGSTDLPLKKPKPSRLGRKKGEKEDCRGFHFESCNTTVGLWDWTKTDKAIIRKGFWGWEDVGREDVCLDNCKEGIHDVSCSSFAVVENSDPASDVFFCGMHNRDPDDLIHMNCKVVTGRVDRSDIQRYESCLFEADRIISETPIQCRSGNCDLSHWGNSFKEGYTSDERRCKYKCYGSRSTTDPNVKCTHYKYKRYTNVDDNQVGGGICELYYLDPTNSDKGYECGAKVMPKASARGGPGEFEYLDSCLSEPEAPGQNGADFCSGKPCNNEGFCENGKCLCLGSYTGTKCEEGPGGGNATATTETPVTGRGTTSATTPTTTTIDCGNARMDIAFLYDDSGSMEDEDQAKVKEWMKKLIDIYQIDGRNQRAAVMEWASGVGETIGFEEELDGEALKQRIDGISHSGGGTNGAMALREAFSRFFNSAGDPDVYQRVFFLSDGDSGDDLAEAARPFHGDLKNGIRMTPIYIGSGEIPQHMIDMLGNDGQTKGYTNIHYQADIDTLSSDQFIEKISGCPLGRALGRSKTG